MTAHKPLKNVEQYLSDDEVVKAILKIMLKSKAWQQHVVDHKGAQLQLLAAPGFHVHDATQSITSTVASVTTPLPKSPRVQRRYGLYQERIPEQVRQSASVAYGSSRPAQQSTVQQVVAGCNCGLVLDINTVGTNMHENGAAISNFKVSYNMMQNAYVNAPENTSYGTQDAKNTGYTTGF